MLRLILAFTLALAPWPTIAATPATATAAPTIHYRTATIDGIDIFYREAGRPDAPTVLLLHGFPTSSRMFRDLMPRLAARYHVIAPDYPGFGHSGTPPREAFHYGFASFAHLIDGLVTKLKVDRYALYVQDYGAPVGYRLALLHPQRVTGLIVQNGNAYEAGLSPFWAPLKALWADPSPANRAAMRAGLTAAATRSQYVDGVADPSLIDPDNWTVDQALLDRPGTDEVMLDLFQDYGTNVSLYPDFQRFFRTRRPPTLIVWGKNDAIFPAAGATAYLADLPDAELHLLDSGHFALEDKNQEIAALMLKFLDRSVAAQTSAKSRKTIP